MNNNLILTVVLLFSITTYLSEQDPGFPKINVIPLPMELNIGEGYFVVDDYRAKGLFDGIRYRGFYIQKEAREVVQYAKERLCTAVKR